MADHAAVGAVGLTLQALLADRLRHPNGSDTPVPVTLGPPGPERDPEGTAESPRVNLFLFRVSESPFLKNDDLPGAAGNGRYGHPPLSLELHYLLTVYGSTANGDFFDETPAHRLLGSAMGILHDHAVITDSLVTRRPPAGAPVLDASLRGERDRIKLTLQPLVLEDLSNMWTALELSYRLSVGYEVSVVRIESRRPRRHPRPVQELPGAGPRVFAATLRRPRIDSVAVRRPGDPADFERPVPFARVGDTLIVRGGDYGGDVRVRLEDLELEPAVVSPAGDRIELTVPDDRMPDGSPIGPASRLQPGTRAVEVVAPAPSLPAVVVASGRAAFALVPRVDGASVTGRTLTLTGSRLVAPDASAQVIVGDRVVEGPDFLPGSDEASVSVTLPAGLPTFPVVTRVSGDLDPFPGLPAQFDLAVTMGTTGPRTVTLAGTPGSLEEAATLLEAALRTADETEAFARARVAATADALVVVPGDLASSVSFGPGALANALRLRGPRSSAREVLLSGVMDPFPRLAPVAPEVEVTLGAVTRLLALGSRPGDLAEAAASLEGALRSAAGTAAFTGARVTVLGRRLCVVPGADVTVAFRPTPGDPGTAPVLQLGGLYLVRVRVAGVESVDETTVELPG